MLCDKTLEEILDLTYVGTSYSNYTYNRIDYYSNGAFDPTTHVYKVITSYANRLPSITIAQSLPTWAERHLITGYIKSHNRLTAQHGIKPDDLSTEYILAYEQGKQSRKQKALDAITSQVTRNHNQVTIDIQPTRSRLTQPTRPTSPHTNDVISALINLGVTRNKASIALDYALTQVDVNDFNALFTCALKGVR